MFITTEKMQSLVDIRTEAAKLATQWFTEQCHNPFTDYYWWYLETTEDQDGVIAIAASCPEGFRLAMPQRLGKGLTVEQNVHQFVEVAKTLPILTLER